MKNQRFRVCLTMLLGFTLAFSAIMLTDQEIQNQQNAASYDKAAVIAQIKPVESSPPVQTAAPEPEADPILSALAEIDLPALQSVNPDVLGWIYIPGVLSYPVLQGDDNAFYLNHTWEKTGNANGSIFLDWKSSPDFQDFNTIIYGHRMRNESMFGTLKYYQQRDFLQQHPTIYIMDNSGVRRYDIFAVWEPSVTSVVYNINFSSGQEKQSFIDTCLSQSQLDTGIIPSPEDKLLTLSTCTGYGYATRWVVQAAERTE